MSALPMQPIMKAEVLPRDYVTPGDWRFLQAYRGFEIVTRVMPDEQIQIGIREPGAPNHQIKELGIGHPIGTNAIAIGKQHIDLLIDSGNATPPKPNVAKKMAPWVIGGGIMLLVVLPRILKKSQRK